ncbi:unnamed protein product [Ranitomeya imitator]|uniref:Uncharacterized protein n=1 Tax=Ranitomeya imitator TaxID=111125 RepID=A0ABN9LPM2_9NEOB|nr:unnamed protein product [Ranitomeya imitator]
MYGTQCSGSREFVEGEVVTALERPTTPPASPARPASVRSHPEIE